MQPKIKICGMTREEDALFALENGADYIGMIFHPGSPRCVSPEKAHRIMDFLRSKGYPSPPAIGVFVNEDVYTVMDYATKLDLYAVQLHGNESPEYCKKISARVIKAIRVREPADLEAIHAYDAWAFLCDAYHPEKYGGTGKRIDASLVTPYVSRRRIFLAGGLRPENVSDALKTVMPFAVDVSSGVESAPGKKDHARIRGFIDAVKRCGLEE